MKTQKHKYIAAYVWRAQRKAGVLSNKLLKLIGKEEVDTEEKNQHQFAVPGYLCCTLSWLMAGNWQLLYLSETFPRSSEDSDSSVPAQRHEDTAEQQWGGKGRSHDRAKMNMKKKVAKSLSGTSEGMNDYQEVRRLQNHALSHEQSRLGLLIS